MKVATPQTKQARLGHVSIQKMVGIACQTGAARYIVYVSAKYAMPSVVVVTVQHCNGFLIV